MFTNNQEKDKKMEQFREIVSWLVMGIGFVGWTVFIPQIRLLVKTKESKSISLGLIWGSFSMQAIMLTHTLLNKDFAMSFALGTSLICLSIIVVLIYYYRKWPSGRSTL